MKKTFLLKRKKMKTLSKIVFTVFLSTFLLSCSQNDENTGGDIQNRNQEAFAFKTFEILEELKTTSFAKEDIKLTVFKNKNGFLTAKYELTGKTKEDVEMGYFAKNKSQNEDGTDSDGKWSCGKAINNCLKNAFISIGACENSVTYCVTCQDPK